MNPVNKTLLEDVVYGYEEIEPCILSALALRENIMIVGAHGIGKTVLGRALGLAMDPSGRGFRCYHADKVLLTDIGGFPDIEASKKTGRYEFAKTNRSIWEAKVALIDELPRGDKQRQNYLMEVIEERTFQGEPHSVDLFIATGNDVTYDGNNDMDAALRSRFLFWLVAPDFRRVESQEAEHMIDINWNRAEKGVDPETMAVFAKTLGGKIDEMRDTITELRNDPAFRRQVTKFVAIFTQLLKDRVASDPELCEDTEAFVCPREFAAQLPQAMVGLTAYYKMMGHPDPAKAAGRMAIKYNIETRHAAAGDKFANICALAWSQLHNMLIDLDQMSTEKGQLQVDFALCLNPSQKIDFWRSNLDRACDLLEPDELRSVAETTLKQIEEEDISQVGPLWHTMRRNGKTEWLAEQVEGFMITEVARKLLAGGTHANADERPLWLKYHGEPNLTPDAVTDILTFSANAA